MDFTLACFKTCSERMVSGVAVVKARIEGANFESEKSCKLSRNFACGFMYISFGVAWSLLDRLKDFSWLGFATWTSCRVRLKLRHRKRSSIAPRFSSLNLQGRNKSVICICDLLRYAGKLPSDSTSPKSSRSRRTSSARSAAGAGLSVWRDFLNE